MRKLTPDEFKNILVAHALWLKELAEGVKLTKGKRADFRNCDLRGYDLSKFDLSYADFTGADLSGANLSRAILIGARLEGAILQNATAIGADLREAILNRADLRFADLAWARLDGAHLVGTDLRYTCIHLYFGASIQPEQVASSILDIHQSRMLVEWKNLARNLLERQEKHFSQLRQRLGTTTRDALPTHCSPAAASNILKRRRLFRESGPQIG